MPSACNAANSKADLTCALATGILYRIGDKERVPVTVIGRYWSFSSPCKSALISRKGSITRPIGRLDNEASPNRVVVKGCPAKIPINKRMVVPEFPMSIDSVGWTNEWLPRP